MYSQTSACLKDGIPIPFRPLPATSDDFPSDLWKAVKVLEIALGAVLTSTRFCLVRISIQDLIADKYRY